MTDTTERAELVEWRPIPNFVGIYEVSSTGDVRSVKTGKMLAKNLAGRGYVKAELWKDGERTQTTVHRTVAIAFLGEPPEGRPEVNHKDGDKTNNNVNNLEWVSRRENALHSMYELGSLVKPVSSWDVLTGEMKHYTSIADAGRDGFSETEIYRCLKGIRTQYEGKLWGPPPPPAAGWDEAIDAACKICSFAIDQTHNMSRMAMAEELRDAIEALRHNAPPDSGAGESGSEPKKAFDETFSAENVLMESFFPDHGGADAGVKPFAWRQINAYEACNGTICRTADEAMAESKRTNAAPSHQPAAAEINASAEARLREEKSAREVRWLVSSARAFLRHFNPCNLAEDKSQQWQSLSHQCDVVERALSPDPHASDRGKQERELTKQEQDCIDAALFASGTVVDETTKSEGGEPDAERTQRRLAVSDDGLGPMQAIPREPPSGPSDPTADVTVEELAKYIEFRQPYPADAAPSLARAILDTFTVGRR